MDQTRNPNVPRAIFNKAVVLGNAEVYGKAKVGIQTKPINPTREAKTMPPVGISDDALYDYYEGIVDFLREQDADGRVFW